MSELTPQSLVRQFRLDLDDVPFDEEDTSAQLWTDEEIYHYLDLAQKKLCKKTYYLQREIERVVVPGLPTITLPAALDDVQSVWMVGAQRDLEIRNQSELDGRLADDYGLTVKGRWREAVGTPQVITFDLLAGRARLVPAPTEQDTLIMTVTVVPGRVTKENSELAISREDHIWALLPGMKAQAYRKQDADSYDSSLAERYAREFDEEIMEVYSDIQRLRKSPRKGSGTTGYGGISF